MSYLQIFGHHGHDLVIRYSATESGSRPLENWPS